MVSVSCLEFVLSKSDVRFGGVIVCACDGGLVNDRLLKTVSVEWACIFLSAVTRFHVLVSISSVVVAVVVAVCCAGVCVGAADGFGCVDVGVGVVVVVAVVRLL